MNTQSEHSKEVFTAIFRRKGGEGFFTKYIDNLSDHEKNLLDVIFRIQTDESPVLVVSKAENPSILITTKRVLVRINESSTESIPLADLVDVEPVNFASTRKDELHLLRVKTLNGIEYTLNVEAGNPYFGIWNILLHVVKKNTKKQE